MHFFIRSENEKLKWGKLWIKRTCDAAEKNEGRRAKAGKAPGGRERCANSMHCFYKQRQSLMGPKNWSVDLLAHVDVFEIKKNGAPQFVVRNTSAAPKGPREPESVAA
jgi:hypothetical protein